jgi:hypothetical protein
MHRRHRNLSGSVSGIGITPDMAFRGVENAVLGDMICYGQDLGVVPTRCRRAIRALD